MKLSTEFTQDEDGSAMVEMGLILPLFLLLSFGLFDFGRLCFSHVMAQKATERAVREAVVRSPACPGVPTRVTRAENAGDASWGASCSTQPGACANPGAFTCTAADGEDSATEIFDAVAILLPNGATTSNLRFHYDYDENLGFLGGPYTPRVTVEIVDLEFEFVTPIGALSRLDGGNETELGAARGFPAMSATLPAEILFDGESS